ncbi:type IV secretory system conjugative DNA transfer family protein [Sinomonas terrae]|uniref:TraM recognition domain-containing protein n=1 Tax=Sinomonas terrae TaxID=2908838 RepID=A0ABS9U7I8_9MICC|nr:TraM recognition domain-containing protein [Sinomonas terrae]MCH6472472.1 TraM recognition domain-containing protein [Sinomonas terrae]
MTGGLTNPANNRVRDPAPAGPWVLVGAMLVVGLAAADLWAAITLSHLLDGTAGALPAAVPDRLRALLQSRVGWTGTTTGILIALAVIEALLAAWVLVRLHIRRRGRSRVDDLAGFMGTGRDIAPLTRKAAAATAKRLGVTAHPGTGHPGASDGGAAPVVGVPLGRHLLTGAPLYGSFEDMMVMVAGPRTGKSTSYVIPAMLEAPGACLATSNKRDVLDATRGVRAARGPVWVFDPQGIAAEDPAWFWDPLSYVTDEVRAAQLAEHFAAGSRDPGAKTDAYFDPAGRKLLAGLLLAAALGNRPITEVYRWLTRPTEDEPVRILARHGHELIADAVDGVIAAPDKQRGGIYGTAQQMAECLTNRQVTQWVTRGGPDDRRPAFDPARFVRSAGTLYSLSKEGSGSAGPLVTALTVAVVEAAEELAVASPGGRLATPLMGVLDEAANVCRWQRLPDLYSHYGSRGIILMTILQSKSQAVDVWGESGWRKLFSAANVKVYGGGVSETGFLEDLSRLVGEHERIRSSTTTGSGSGSQSVSYQVQRQRTLDVADLAALPKGRALVFASGARPALVRTVPWMAGPHAQAVKASILAHNPAGQNNLETAMGDVAAAVAAEAKRSVGEG